LSEGIRFSLLFSQLYTQHTKLITMIPDSASLLQFELIGGSSDSPFNDAEDGTSEHAFTYCNCRFRQNYQLEAGPLSS
jgi:hypothetical protein